jgi:hypothetical protein
VEGGTLFEGHAVRCGCAYAVIHGPANAAGVELERETDGPVDGSRGRSIYYVRPRHMSYSLTRMQALRHIHASQRRTFGWGERPRPIIRILRSIRDLARATLPHVAPHFDNPFPFDHVYTTSSSDDELNAAVRRADSGYKCPGFRRLA